LGSTGSIGVNCIKIALANHLDIDVLVAGSNIVLLNQQIAATNPRVVVIANKQDIHKVNHTNTLHGTKAILEVIETSSSVLVVNALVGFIGLAPTLKAISCGKTVALANKESLVTAGQFIDTSKIIAIDSEHFSLQYILDKTKKLDRLTITASGGSFRDLPLNRFKDISVADALKHPNWSMGNKITIDSATMANKLLEVVEAYWLFDTKNIHAIIEPKSIVHAFVSYSDGSTVAHMANPSMQMPISYALTGDCSSDIIKPISLVHLASLEFREIDEVRYPIFALKDDMLRNPSLAVVLNTANEIAVAKFLNQDISFVDISSFVLNCVDKYHDIKINSIDDIYNIDKQIRQIEK
jgi:1-deoxy-D-xylulose-5-phosphate reductoisomerase